jgi:hypothetical protein
VSIEIHVVYTDYRNNGTFKFRNLEYSWLHLFTVQKIVRKLAVAIGLRQQYIFGLLNTIYLLRIE